MAQRRQGANSPLAKISRQSTDLAWAAPEVISHRLAKMASAGVNPSAGDYREFTMMGMEKVTAFYQSWFAMAQESMRLSQQIYWSQWNLFFSPIGLGVPISVKSVDPLNVLSKGLAPIHKQAVSNVKRLRKG